MKTPSPVPWSCRSPSGRYRTRPLTPLPGTISRQCLVPSPPRSTWVDAASIVVGGCSGEGDLALQVASETNVAAVVAGDPASVVMAGMFNDNVPRKRDRYIPEDSSSCSGIRAYPRQDHCVCAGSGVPRTGGRQTQERARPDSRTPSGQSRQGAVSNGLDPWV